MASKRQKVCVIFGGQSSEHEVSRVSATYVINNLDKEKYNVLMLGITKKGAWYLYTGKVEKLADGSWEKDKKHLKHAVISPCIKDRGLLVTNDDGSIKKVKLDVIFPVLHGMYGEDGTVQGLFELSGIAYAGCGVLASSVGMNKIYAKYVFEKAGLSQAKWRAVYTKDFANMDKIIDEISSDIGYPCFVKPANAGSSVGISKVNDKTQLEDALRLAAIHDRQIVVEEAIVGHEVECAVLGNASEGNVRASGVGEIVSGIGFYDYDEKYKTDTAQLIIPANIDAKTTEKIRESAIKAFYAVDGAGLSRVDFFVTDKNEVIINEINTLPGFTSISMYPKLWQKAGISYQKLLDEIIELTKTRQK